ncbi:MAG: hypothetical protein WEB60_05635 [Terrimicrobiaceae bacterium]
MSQLSINKFGDNLPVTGIIAFSQAAMGFGVGILLGDRLGRTTRHQAAIACLIAGAAALAPVVYSVVVNVRNRPSSSRRMKKQLESIRRDTGLTENSDQF